MARESKFFTWGMLAPIAGCRGTGDTIGAVLFIGGDESGLDLTTVIASRR